MPHSVKETGITLLCVRQHQAWFEHHNVKKNTHRFKVSELVLIIKTINMTFIFVSVLFEDNHLLIVVPGIGTSMY